MDQYGRMANGQRVTMLIYPHDKEFIRKSTLDYPNIETGGDLFGLWQSESEVVVQLVTGPGKNCRRTPTAFFQDKTYLSQVGVYLTTAKGLCNVGEWHSHHRLNLPEPSAGDRATVWRNMPGCGLKRFLLIIATITPTRQVNINGFMFTAPENGRSHGGMEHVQTRVLNGPNPFRNHDEVLARLDEGKEMLDSNAPSPHTPMTLDENDGKPSSKPKKKDKKKKKKAKKNISQPTEKSKKSKKKFPRIWKRKGSYTVLENDGGTSRSGFQSNIQSDPMPTQSSNNIDVYHNQQYGQTTPQHAPTHQQKSESNQPSPHSPANRSNAQRPYKVTYQMTSNV